jgi:hypothetical protein
MKLASALYLLIIPGAGLAQETPRQSTHNNNGWYMYFGDHALKGKWRLHLEGQWRRHELGAKWQQLLLRPGVNYELNPNVMLTGGYAYIDTQRYGAFPVRYPFQEHRLFQQLILRHKAGAVDFQHRYRMEQRWLEEFRDLPGGFVERQRWRYQNRFRYFVKASIPLSRNAASPWYLGLYDEVFVGFAPNAGASLFDQNRAYAAIGYKLNRTTRVEAGYLQQTLAQRNGRIIEYNHTLALSIFSSFPFQRR